MFNFGTSRCIHKQITQMQKTLQDQLLDLVLARFEKRSLAVDTMTQMLSIGKDAVYRRLRGDTLLTPDEMRQLSLHFNISLDALINKHSNTVFFSYNLFNTTINNFDDYLNGIYQDLDQISKASQPKISYATAEVPLFYYCLFPELIAFKLYVWGRTVWDFEYLKDRTFDFDLVPYPTLKLAEDLVDLFRNIPSVEFWSQSLVDFTLSQAEYHVISGGFTKSEDALVICDRLLDLVAHLRTMADKGCKFKANGNPEDALKNGFELYHNEMVFANNTVLVETESTKMLYTAFGNPNFLRSTDHKMCDYTQDWFSRMKVKSEKISLQSEKNRAWYFNGIKRKIEMVKNRIENYLGIIH